jgi:hypothetical protein
MPKEHGSFRASLSCYPINVDKLFLRGRLLD